MAVTGGMGDVTNTFAYDAYGRLTEKVGLDDILFCYNGKYGVITEPSGLVYMRARYYSPELRRFINADVVAGEISNAITLNRYAYANGNPISNVDPLGLTAERGAIVYNGNTYDIFVPESVHDLDGWTFVDRIEDDNIKRFTNLFKFLITLAADDVNGIATGDPEKSKYADNKGKIRAGAFGLLLGLADAFNNSVDQKGFYYNLSFYQKGDDRRAIIQIGFPATTTLFEQYANGVAHSLMLERYPMNSVGEVSYKVKKFYDKIIGTHSSWKNYDMEITADEAHRNSKYSSYLWIDSDGTFMLSPIIYRR